MAKRKIGSVNAQASKTLSSRGPVTRRSAPKGATPRVSKKPVGSRERKVAQLTTNKPYWQQQKDKFGV